MEQQQQEQQQLNSSLPDKVILVIIDGIGDITIPAFGDRTPLQVAHTPNLDCIAGVMYCLRDAPCKNAAQHSFLGGVKSYLAALRTPDDSL
jgi:hypothetical protein